MKRKRQNDDEKEEDRLVTLTTLEVLSLVPNLLKDKLHSLRNLELLRVKMEGISSAGLSKTVCLYKQQNEKVWEDKIKPVRVSAQLKQDLLHQWHDACETAGRKHRMVR
ncbi:hypothetical protein P8452_41110 [Trifolium repens]|nr:hypothetical protein P8452_41110 [Trifolium repens]